MECAARKEEDVREKMQQTLTVLDSLQGKLLCTWQRFFTRDGGGGVSTPLPISFAADSLPREWLSYLKGKALNVLPEHSPEAESLLARAVKQDPSLSDAWVQLGESYWKNGCVQQARDCFVSSINHVSKLGCSVH